MIKRIDLVNTWQSYVETDHDDPDRKRRAQTLNILLAALFVMATLALLFTLTMEITGVFPPAETRTIYIPSALLSLLIIGIYYLNRAYPTAASVLFLVILILILAAGDEPAQVAAGRVQLFLAIPIIMAAMVLPPWTTFVFAGLVSATTGAIGSQVGIVFTPFASFAYVVIALVSYLGASQLEQALRRLRRTNEELDQRVEERTRDLVDANRQLADANDRLRELDRLKSRFLSMVSHELRTPLSAIQGFSEMLLAGIYGPITPGQRNALDRITGNTLRLLDLVGDLLDRARIEAGQLALHLHPFSPAELAEDVETTLNVLAQSKGLTLTTSVASDLPALIRGDEARLRQILMNLVNNGLKFTERGGVMLHMSLSQDKSGGPEPTWIVSVSDTGPGIADEERAAVFEPFRRVDDSSTRREMGVGLGLSIVRDLIELMDGTLTLESTVGLGSTFTIVLPLLPEKEMIHE